MRVAGSLESLGVMGVVFLCVRGESCAGEFGLALAYIPIHSS